MIEDKIQLDPSLDVDQLLNRIEQTFANEQLDNRDGVKIDFSEGWVHLRKSNTEPIIRVYAEAATASKASELIQNLKSQVNLS